MLSARRFARLDGSRLDRRVLQASWPDVVAALAQLRTSHAAYAGGAPVGDLHRSSQGLVDTLNAAHGVGPKRVFLRDRPRPHRRRQGRIVYELHGQCDPEGPLEVYTRTAARAQTVALKTLLNTLLHEWVHHLDFERFGASVHSSGFYERLAQVYRPVRDLLGRRERR